MATKRKATSEQEIVVQEKKSAAVGQAEAEKKTKKAKPKRAEAKAPSARAKESAAKAPSARAKESAEAKAPSAKVKGSEAAEKKAKPKSAASGKVTTEKAKKTVKTDKAKKTVKTEKEKKTAKAAEAGTKARSGAAEVSKTKAIKVLFASPEVMPFAGTGGLGEVAGSLPAALKRMRRPSVDCRVIMPLYGIIGQQYRDKMKFLGHIDIPVGWRSQYMGIFELKMDQVTYYFVDNEYYFKRDGIYGYYDECERFSYFSRAAMESYKITGFQPDIIHANDWQTALIPVYGKTFYKDSGIKTVFTVHNIEYQGHYGEDVLEECIGLDPSDDYIVKFEDDVNLMKGAIESADRFTTVSPTYARELMDPISAFGLHEIVRRNEWRMEGILNGINTKSYDPENDPNIAAPYSAKDIQGKKKCKEALQKELGLPVKDVPMVTLISRLVAPKGVDIISQMLDHLLYENDMQFVMLGTGDGAYEGYFRGLQQRHPEQVVSMIEFDTSKAHKVYAAGDILLMPSRSEPCGLAQMIACRYGNAPIVRLTGGLADSISEWDGEKGNGFTFYDYNSGELEYAVNRALELYGDKAQWEKLVKHILGIDFSWSRSAKEYKAMYMDLLGQ